MLLAADPAAPRVLGRARALDAAVRGAPALSGGRLHLRNDAELVAFDRQP